MRIQRVELKNFVLFERLEIQPTGLTFVKGENDVGKTAVLKLVYAVTRAYQEYKETGKKKSGFKICLSDKLLWTFMPESLGSLVRKGSKRAEIFFETNLFRLKFSFSSRTNQVVRNLQLEELGSYQPYNVLFIPSMELFSLVEAVRAGREEKEKYWFDDTCYTLVQALSASLFRGKPDKRFVEVLRIIKGVTHGHVEKISESFHFKKGKRLHEIRLVGEGLKKMGMLEWLIKNGSIRKNTVLIIDGLESGLSSAFVTAITKAIHKLAQIGLTIFVAVRLPGDLEVLPVGGGNA